MKKVTKWRFFGEELYICSILRVACARKKYFENFSRFMI